MCKIKPYISIRIISLYYAFYETTHKEIQDLDWCRAHLSEENLEWLTQLPYQVRDEELGLCYTHGSPIAPEDYAYVFALEQARELVPLRSQLSDANFIGHSHLCKSFAIGPDDAHDVVAQRFGVRKGYNYIITVGSVGQPRDYDNRACCGVFDTNARTFEYVRVEYDIESAARKIFEAELALNFGKRLFLGI